MAISRRYFLTGASVLALTGGALARSYRGSVPWSSKTARPPSPAGLHQTFFSAEERSVIVAMVDRLIPKDEFPSASEAGVVTFLEDQLAGPYGRGDIYYLQGPFQQGTESQGYQAEAPAILYRQAIADLETAIRKEGTDGFTALDAEAQDDFLTALSEGEQELEHVDAKTFFDRLWEDTQLGYFGDPVHGGNRDMVGWKMIGFPGARYDYRPYIDHNGKALDLPPVSVAGNYQREAN
ncbi:gluconate 2-dehydrogenase subunit 3 family protein [Pseudohoeflea coraliihabitans]|uniref:Gluconate 2-dehydrogenase subunit 3 family protein n=1 Tax=Pseudohoeflea coraliihabitans TaxID=2860393 RepID=A0ABS6WLQ4_9HYPH|nr:gluconate 2-dehydrogenase subunit 3 family protein [Pseudohoeflea sp. DP4N28-3]MBW3096872.1 gluconate 2-dehydrogenase subunit 3 family protein [Pseudohoeflea sp. DP4N28-3]